MPIHARSKKNRLASPEADAQDGHLSNSTEKINH